MADAEIVWTRWGIGVEFSFGHWIPREWSAYLHIGPLLAWAGREKCPDYTTGEPGELCPYCDLPYPSSRLLGDRGNP